MPRKGGARTNPLFGTLAGTGPEARLEPDATIRRRSARRRIAIATWMHNPSATGGEDPLTPNAARTITAGDSGREPAPETVDAQRCRMTRHGVSTARCRIIVKPGASSQSSLRCRSSVEPFTSPECGGFPLLSCPLGSIPDLVSSVVTGYKTPLSGGFLLGAAGPVGVQDVLFAGVFVPQVWNQHAGQSASRTCPVGVWLHLYLGVPASFHRFDFPCKLLYRARLRKGLRERDCQDMWEEIGDFGRFAAARSMGEWRKEDAGCPAVAQGAI